jgi:hypothetical protein
MDYTCYTKYIQTTRGPPLMLQITIGNFNMSVQCWELHVEDLEYRLYVDVKMTKEDARLELINVFTKMGVKNGYGFGSPCPELKWEEHF